MPAGQYTFTIEQGATVDFRIDYQNSDGTPVNLTNYSARMQIRPTFTSPTVYASLFSTLWSDRTGLNMTPVSASKVLPKSSGSIGIYISAATTSLMSFDQAVYDLEVYSGSGAFQYVIRVLEGKVKLKKNVTR